mmetsp:Transcript_13479/g.29279  ORF Transcript_13479/g.29279 Transcript_13479/m.29279 type:complete len:116 (-) Transcript_13479:2579-2926(-)
MKHQRAIKLLQCALFWAVITSINVAIAEATGTDAYSQSATSTTYGESGKLHSAGDDYYVSHGDDGDDQHAHPVTAILFPWFSEIIGVLTFFVIYLGTAILSLILPPFSCSECSWA